MINQIIHDLRPPEGYNLVGRNVLCNLTNKYNIKSNKC